MCFLFLIKERDFFHHVQYPFSFPLFWWAPSSNRGRKARDCSGPGWSILADITPSLVSKTNCELLQEVKYSGVQNGAWCCATPAAWGRTRSRGGAATSAHSSTFVSSVFLFFCWKTVIVRAPVVCPCLPPYNNTWNPGFGRCTINIASTQDSHRYLIFLIGPVTVKIPSGLSVFVRKFSNIVRQCQGSSELLRS